MKLKKMKLKEELTLRGSSIGNGASSLRTTHRIINASPVLLSDFLGFRPFRNLK